MGRTQTPSLLPPTIIFMWMNSSQRGFLRSFKVQAGLRWIGLPSILSTSLLWSDKSLKTTLLSDYLDTLSSNEFHERYSTTTSCRHFLLDTQRYFSHTPSHKKGVLINSIHYIKIFDVVDSKGHLQYQQGIAYCNLAIRGRLAVPIQWCNIPME